MADLTIKFYFRNFLKKRAKVARQHYLKQSNIYIFPGRQGLGFVVMLGLMLITAINYQSSLIYLVVFIFGSIFLISIWLCFFNLQGMSIRAEDVKPVQAGSRASLTFLRSDNGKDRSSIFANLEEGADYRQWPEAQEVKALTLVGPKLSRGLYSMPALKVETYFPFGLIRAWTWLWFDVPLIIYPEPVQPPESVESAIGSDRQGRRHQTSELSELKPFEQGASTKRIFWKHYARRGELVVRAPELADAKDSELNWEHYASFGQELALSYLCYEVLQRSNAGRMFTLVLPGVQAISGSGEEHKVKCLSALAAYSGGVN